MQRTSFMCLLLTLLLALAPAQSTAASAPELTEVAVRELVAALDRAVLARDTAAIGALMSDDVRIMVNSSVSGQPGQVALSKSAYLKFLQQAWTAASDYRYQRSNQNIVLRGNRAVVTADVWESMTMDGRSFITRSRETTTVELVEGKLLATAISATSSE